MKQAYLPQLLAILLFTYLIKEMISTVRRPEVPLNATHEEYFETLMKDRVNLSPETKIPELSARVQFNITGGGAGTWTLVLENGYAKEVVKNYQGSHDCGLTMEGTTFMDIVRGKTTPHKALFDGKLSVSGNVLLGIKMSVLAHYL